jgi:phosphoribosylformimino-5-aminoimidazole carboxamide ribotide isomerase
MLIIPAIDLIDGKCVRLTKGDYSSIKTYSNDPLEVAKQFEAHGLNHLHLVDLDGAKSKHIINYNVLEKLATKTNLKIDFGGGVKSDQDIKIAFECGAQKITGGSIAVHNKKIFENWISLYGSNKIILGADVKNERIALNGWIETSDENLINFIEYYKEKGIKEVICTDVSKDGMLQGPSIKLYKKILAKFKDIQLIASGGVAKISDLIELSSIGCKGVIIGKAIYEKKIKLKEIENYIK